ncbi:hypothetical protein [Bifidobacterium aerophilum]|uniref:Uncharacterized protein n=1 Tax=Bifidobacterium aerophilum TaxID=1798155 RepID=A0A6N9Z3N5_9BIFI|nr:hypothetical protein [Bifidobacterium aerophilum]NEG89198.1 hypothetical protein [Bifidobacterium aerophilum]
MSDIMMTLSASTAFRRFTMLSTAWGDESIRNKDLDHPWYLMGASLIEGNLDSIRSELMRLKPAGAKKLHWHDMTPRFKNEVIKSLEGMESLHIIVVGERMTHMKDERARRKCLERLLPILEGYGIEQLVLEARTDVLNKADNAHRMQLERMGVVSRIRITHMRGDAEPLLWLPDQALGAYVDTRLGLQDFNLFTDTKVIDEQVVLT